MGQIRLILQEQSDLDLHCQKSFKKFLADNKVDDLCCIGTLRVDKCELSLYSVMLFVKCMHVCMAKTTY